MFFFFLILQTTLKIPRLKPGVNPSKNLTNVNIALENESDIILSVISESPSLEIIEVTGSQGSQQNGILFYLKQQSHLGFYLHWRE